MKRWIRVLVGLGIAGILATWALANAAQQRAQDTRQNDLDAATTELARAAADRLGETVDNTESLARVTSDPLLAPQDFEVMWGSSFNNFGGDSEAFAVAEVARDQADDFAHAMNELVPGFKVAFEPVDDAPNHLLVASGAPAAGPVLGFDLASQSVLNKELLGIRPDGLSIDGLDTRKAAAETGDMRILRAHPMVGPDGKERQGWTATFVDLTAILAPALADVGDNYGAQFTTTLTGDAGAYGPEPTDDDFTATSIATIDFADRHQVDAFEVTVTTWSDGSHVPVTSARTILLIGVAITAAVLALGALALVIASLIERADRSHEAARHDAMTGLPNRRWLLEHLPDAGPCAVLFCDLDRFKVVNDSAGHGVGDELLNAVAHRLEQVVGATGTVSRYGGDEFIVVCSDDTADLDTFGIQLAQRVLDAFDRPFGISTGDVRMTMSIGIANRADAQTSTEEVIREADVALSECKKRRGRDGFVLYSESLKDAERDRLRLETQLQNSLDAGHFEVHYQPILNGDSSPRAFEALVRWKRDGALVYADEFLPAIAELQRMGDLGRIVLGKALATFGSAIRAGTAPVDVRLQVNVDAVQLEDHAFPATVGELLESTGVEPGQLVLELTEGEWVQSMDRIEPVLAELTDLGVGLAIDDFGSGYSSLERLLSIRGLTQIKIDRSLVRASTEERIAGFLSGLVDGMSHLGVHIVAEGIETIDELRRMRSLGVDGFQGHLFARSGPPEEVGFAS